MKDRETGSPAKKIKEFAKNRPGGLIRWHEARDIYLQESGAARRDERRAVRLSSLLRGDRRHGNRNYHMTLAQLLKRNFLKVGGTDGFYVLKTSVVGDTEGDVLDVDLYEYEREAA